MWTHKQLVERAERWLRNTQHCSIVLTEAVSSAGEQPDAIGWKDGHSILVECKASRTDFQQDALKVHRRLDCIGMGSERYFLCVEGLIKVSDLPSRWGLLWLCKDRVMVVKKSEKFEYSQLNEIRLLCSAVRRQEKPAKAVSIPTEADTSEISNQPVKVKGKTKMPVAEPTIKRNPIPAGDHVLTLVSVETKDQPSFNDSSVMETRWIWQFKAQQKDPETGERYEFRQYTGTRYGNAKAGLTILLDQMLPDWDDEDKGTIDTDDILNTSYKARIRHDKPEKAGDAPKPRLVFIEPYKKPKAEKTAPAKVQEEEEEDPDPFIDE